ncbi:AAA family ATPase [Paenibacillus larvae]
MRINELIIKNFKNIGTEKPCKIVFPVEDDSDLISIIGENNIGKSSVLEALRLFMPGYVSTPDLNMFPFRREPQSADHYMEICVTFGGLTEQDLNHKYIKPYVYDGVLRVKRTWSGTGLKDSEVPFEVFIPNRYIEELSDKKTWNAKTLASLSRDLNRQYELYCTRKGLSAGETITKANQEDFVEFVYENNAGLIMESEPKWQPNPNGFASKFRSIMPKVIYVPAVKLAEEEASAQKNKSAANLIVSALFDRYLNTSGEIQQFQSAIQAIRNLFSGETAHDEIRRIQDRITQKLKRVIEADVEFDFTPPEVMDKLHLNSNILIKYNDFRTAPEHQGNGAQRLLILSLLEMMAEYIKESSQETESEWQRSFLFLIEEPEIYLHPQLQRKMRNALVSISKSSHAQVVCTSHSEQFINLADRHQGIVLFKKQANGTAKCIQVTGNIYEGETKKDQRDRMRMLLNFTSSTLEAFFAERVVLVEGDCEVASIYAISNKLKEIYPDKIEDINQLLHSICIVPCNGKLTQLAFFKVLRHFGIDSYLIHDLDGHLPNEGNNKIILNGIGSEEYRYTHDPNFEGDIFDQYWSGDKPWRATEKIYNHFAEYKEKLLSFFSFVVGKERFETLNLESAD